MSTYLVVGANRGIGLALVEELFSRDPAGTILATTRNPSDSKDLDEVAAKSQGKVIIVQLDMLDETSIQGAIAKISEITQTLDTVYINSGVLFGFGPLQDVSAADLLANLDANVVGPHNMLRALAPLVLASKASKRTIAVTSSLVGSATTFPTWSGFAKQIYGLDYIPNSAYSVSKSAVDMLVIQWADWLGPQGVAVMAVHPGPVATRMGKGVKKQFQISPEESAKGLVDVVEKVEVEKATEGMYSYDGTVAPW